ncbi:hypothetical protein OG943_40130 [Amycolatopsis sp. NBC_00345]|uniref:hypothetical protein n=1 Tax=Amycolatopsis sp. NBC_00345 TaxID=2975955 RepID=UPI002E256CB6
MRYVPAGCLAVTMVLLSAVTAQAGEPPRTVVPTMDYRPGNAVDAGPTDPAEAVDVEVFLIGSGGSSSGS